MHCCERVCVKNGEPSSTTRLTKVFSRLVTSFGGLVLSHHYTTVHVVCCYNCFLPYCNEFCVGRDDIVIIIAVCG